MSKSKQALLRAKYTVLYGLALGHRSFESDVKYKTAERIVVSVLGALGKHMSIYSIYNAWKKLMNKYEYLDNYCIYTVNDQYRYVFLFKDKSMV